MNVSVNKHGKRHYYITNMLLYHAVIYVWSCKTDTEMPKKTNTG